MNCRAIRHRYFDKLLAKSLSSHIIENNNEKKNNDMSADTSFCSAALQTCFNDIAWDCLV